MAKDAKKPVPEKYFYHSFPQQGAGDPDLEKKNGLAILESIAKNGLLLTPEKIEWRETRTLKSGGTIPSVPWVIFQKRCCFTELSPHELIKHSEKYGRFALEFEIETLRHLGGMPVFYIPKDSGKNLGLEGLGAMLVARLGEIQGLLKKLASLEDSVKNNPNKNELILVEKDGHAQGTIQCTVSGTKDLIAFLRLRHGNRYTQSIKTLLNTINGMAGLFAPTEDINSTELLRYYREREWRILERIKKDEKELTRELNKTEKEMLLKLNRDFFETEIEVGGSNYRCVDKCDIYPELNGKPIIQYVRRVIVPNNVTNEVSRLLGTIEDAPKVVAIETLLP